MHFFLNVWLLSLSRLFLRFIYVVAYICSFSFSMLSCILLNKYTTLYLPTFLMMCFLFSPCYYCSVPQSCLTLFDPMDCSTPGFPVHHQLLEFAPTHVHWVADAIQPSHPVVPFSSYLQSFPASGAFLMTQLFTSGGESIAASASASVRLMNIQDWLVWSLCSPKDSQVPSPTPQFKNINTLMLSFLYSPTLTSIHDYWENHSFD